MESSQTSLTLRIDGYHLHVLVTSYLVLHECTSFYSANERPLNETHQMFALKANDATNLKFPRWTFQAVKFHAQGFWPSARANERLPQRGHWRQVCSQSAYQSYQFHAQPSYLPELSTNLVATLASLQMNHLMHTELAEVKVEKHKDTYFETIQRLLFCRWKIFCWPTWHKYCVVRELGLHDREVKVAKFEIHENSTEGLQRYDLCVPTRSHFIPTKTLYVSGHTSQILWYHHTLMLRNVESLTSEKQITHIVFQLKKYIENVCMVDQWMGFDGLSILCARSNRL